MTSQCAVVDTSVVIALVRGDVFTHLPQVFQPIYIGRRVVAECRRRDSDAYAAVQQASSGQNAWLTIVNQTSWSRVYAPALSMEDIEGIEIALDKKAILLTQDDTQEIEAKNAGIQYVVNTMTLLFAFKQGNLIRLVRPVLEQMERKGESLTPSQKNELLRKVGELIP